MQQACPLTVEALRVEVLGHKSEPRCKQAVVAAEMVYHNTCLSCNAVLGMLIWPFWRWQ